MLAAEVSPMEPATGALTLGDDGILPISEGVHCPVHAAVRQIDLARRC